MYIRVKASDATYNRAVDSSGATLDFLLPAKQDAAAAKRWGGRTIPCRVSSAGHAASSQHFRSFWGAWHTIAGYEAIHMIRKGHACWSAAGARVGLLHRFIVGMFALGV
jgi:transposase-like protein